MQYRLEALATCAAVFVYLAFRRYRRRSVIRDIPGPVNPSWIFGMSLGHRLFSLPLTWVDGADCKHPQGHQWYLQSGAGEVEKRFLENFGNVARLNGPLGVRFGFHWIHATARCA